MSEKTEDKDEELATLMKQANGSMIIYCATKKEVERLYQLYRGSFSVGYYHGGLDASQRRQLQLQFSQNKLQFLVATNAFGMGIDKPDIRAVVHYDLPDSLKLCPRDWSSRQGSATKQSNFVIQEK